MVLGFLPYLYQVMTAKRSSSVSLSPSEPVLPSCVISSGVSAPLVWPVSSGSAPEEVCSGCSGCGAPSGALCAPLFSWGCGEAGSSSGSSGGCSPPVSSAPMASSFSAGAVGASEGSSSCRSAVLPPEIPSLPPSVSPEEPASPVPEPVLLWESALPPPRSEICSSAWSCGVSGRRCARPAAGSRSAAKSAAQSNTQQLLQRALFSKSFFIDAPVKRFPRKPPQLAPFQRYAVAAAHKFKREPPQTAGASAFLRAAPFLFSVQWIAVQTSWTPSVFLV